MANRFWVGGAGTWDATTTHWSATSGGGSGATVPSGADAVFIDSLSGSPGTITISGSRTANSLTVSVTGWTIAGTGLLTLGQTGPTGSITLNSGTTWTQTGGLTLVASGTITTNAVSLATTNFTAQGSTPVLAGALTVKAISITSFGGINLVSYTLTGTTFVAGTAVTLAFGTGNITVNGSGASLVSVPAPTVTGTPVINVSNNSSAASTVNISSSSEVSSVSFNITVGNYALTLAGRSRNLNFTGFTGPTTFSSHINYGNVTLASAASGATYGTGTLTFSATSSKTITANSASIASLAMTFNGVAGTWVLQDNISTTAAIALTNGTLDLNGKTFTTSFNARTAAGTKNLTFNGGTLLLSGTATVWNNASPTGFTTTAGTGTGSISMSSASAKTFTGGGSIYNCTLSNDGAGELTVSGSNTFTTIANTVQPTTFIFTASTTQTVTNFSVSGTSGNIVTINSSPPGAAATLSKASGTVNANYLSLQDSTATGGATWNATNSTNVSGNTGWNFLISATSNFFALF